VSGNGIRIFNWRKLAQNRADGGEQLALILLG